MRTGVGLLAVGKALAVVDDVDFEAIDVLARLHDHRAPVARRANAVVHRVFHQRENGERRDRKVGRLHIHAIVDTVGRADVAHLQVMADIQQLVRHGHARIRAAGVGHGAQVVGHELREVCSRLGSGEAEVVNGAECVAKEVGLYLGGRGDDSGVDELMASLGERPILFAVLPSDVFAHLNKHHEGSHRYHEQREVERIDEQTHNAHGDGEGDADDKRGEAASPKEPAVSHDDCEVPCEGEGDHRFAVDKVLVVVIAVGWVEEKDPSHIDSERVDGHECRYEMYPGDEGVLAIRAQLVPGVSTNDAKVQVLRENDE